MTAASIVEETLFFFGRIGSVLFANIDSGSHGLRLIDQIDWRDARVN